MKRKGYRGYLAVLAGAGAFCLLTACSAQDGNDSAAEEDSVQVQTEEKEGVDLSGDTLMVFCGAGMKDPFEEIASMFEEETGCTVEVVYANAAQIQTQIKTAQEGDYFIAGSGEEVTPVEEYVSESKNLVLHIPVLAVSMGNPAGISGIADLADQNIRLIIGDPESTPIGKIAVKALEDYGITDQVNIISQTTTAPAMSLALENGECDAAIVWKENVDESKADITAEEDMKDYIKTIPAARLSFAENDAADVFWTYLDGGDVQSVWTAYGYELAEE